MASIRSTNTKPELALRVALRKAGAVGYRIHVRDLPGRPDVAFTRWRVAVFVDGAFWHGHPDHFNPDTATDYWRDKIARNRVRDERATADLVAQGWTVLRAWDFEVHRRLDGVVGEVLGALGEAGWPGGSL